MRDLKLGNVLNFKTVILLIVCLFIFIFLNQCKSVSENPVIEVKKLPYDYGELEPFISSDTMKTHYDGHYKAYVSRAINLTNKRAFRDMPVEEILSMTSEKRKYTDVFNNLAQAWNHEFFWLSLKPDGGGKPTDEIAHKIEQSFGSFRAFKKELLEYAGKHFGVGWVWLVMDGDSLAIITTQDADTPVAHGLYPIFTIDIWEHAYYLDYKSNRSEYIEEVLDNLINWDFADVRLKNYYILNQ